MPTAPIPPSTLTFTSLEDCLRQMHARIAPDVRAAFAYLEANDPNAERRYDVRHYIHPLFTSGAYWLEELYKIDLGASGGGKPGFVEAPSASPPP